MGLEKNFNEMTVSQKNLLLNILRLSCFLVFIGRAWQHLFWDAPFRTLLWDEALMDSVINALFGMSWFDYVTSPSTDSIIQYIIRGFGVFYLIMAILTLAIQRQHLALGVLYIVASVCLAFLAFLYCKEKFYHSGQFLEYAIQVLSPIFFYRFLNTEKPISQWWLKSIKLTIALTFAAHGLYAFGFYPRPGVFVDMVINILGVSEPTAHLFLQIAGVLDFIVAVGMFIPQVSIYCLVYCILWGLFTALARTWANVDFGSFAFSLLHQYLPETIYRLPHALIPLVAFFLELIRRRLSVGRRFISKIQ